MEKIKNLQVIKAVKLIKLSMVGFLIEKNGNTTVSEIESFIGIKNLSTDIVANLLKIMVNDGHIKINGSDITSSVANLKKIMRDEQIILPSCHGNPWSEADYIKIAKLQMDGVPINRISVLMNRTERSVSMQSTLLRKAYRLIEIVENNPIVSEFVKTTGHPKAEVKKAV